MVSSGLFWGGPLKLPTARAVRALVSTLPLWFRANSVAFRCSHCGFARIPLCSPCGFREFRPLVVSSGLFWGGPLKLPTARAVRALVSTLPLWFRANSVAFRCSHCGFARIPLHFDAPAVVSREFRPLVASSGLFWGGHLGCRPQWRARWDGSLVSMLPLWFRANSVAFRCSRCGFVRIPLHFDAPAVVSREFRPLVASSGGSDFGVEHHEHQLGLLAPKFQTRAKPNLPGWRLFDPQGNSAPRTCTFCLRECRCSSGLFGLFWPSSLFGVYACIILFRVLCPTHVGFLREQVWG